MAQRADGTRAGFLVMTFAVVGLTGIFATYAAPLPLERALARDVTLDEVLAAARAPESAAALEALRPRLGDSADSVLGGPGDIAQRVQAARIAMRTELTKEAAATSARLRLLIGVITAVAAIFGTMMMNVSTRRRE